MAAPTSAARAGSSSRRVISRRTHSSKAARSSEPSGLILSSSVVTVVEHAARDRGAERPADQAAALLADALLDGGAEGFLLPASSVPSCPRMKPNTS